MGYTKKSLQELDLIDNFLSNAIASNEEINEPFYRLLLSVLLGRKLKKIQVLAQQIIPATTPELRGIRMDVEITECDEGKSRMCMILSRILRINFTFRGTIDTIRPK